MPRDQPTVNGGGYPGAYVYSVIDNQVPLTPGTPHALILNRLSGETFEVFSTAGSERPAYGRFSTDSPRRTST
jgi:hypothetical protein